MHTYPNPTIYIFFSACLVSTTNHHSPAYMEDEKTEKEKARGRERWKGLNFIFIALCLRGCGIPLKLGMHAVQSSSKDEEHLSLSHITANRT